MATLVSALAFACSRAEAPRPAASASPFPSGENLARPLPSPVPDVVARINGQDIHVAQILPLAKAELDRGSVFDRDARKPEVLRLALREYIDRELLLQEALAQGVEADRRAVDWAYDQLRRDHPDETQWAEFLARQGLDPQRLKAELRANHTVAALIEQELRALPIPAAELRAAFDADPAAFAGSDGTASFEAARGRVEEALRQQRRDEVRRALLERLRARARIETFL